MKLFVTLDSEVRTVVHEGGAEVEITRHHVAAASSRRQKQYLGTIEDLIAEADSVAKVDEYLAIARQDCTPSAKTARRWLLAGTLRKVALLTDRVEIHGQAIEAGGKLPAKEARLVREAVAARLVKLDEPVSQYSTLVDASGVLLQAAA